MDIRSNDNCVESRSAKMFRLIFTILFYGVPFGLAAFPGFPGLGQFPGGQQSMFPFFNQGQGQQPNQNGGNNNGIGSPWSPFFPSSPFQQQGQGQGWPGFNNPAGANPYQQQQQPVQGQGQQPPSPTTPNQQYYNQGPGTPVAPVQPQQSQTPGVQQGYGQPNPAVAPQQQQQPYQNSPYQAPVGGTGYPGYANNQNQPYYNQQNQNGPPQNGYSNTPQQQNQNQPSPPNSNQWNPPPNQNQGQQVPQPQRQWDDGQYKQEGYQPVNNNYGQQQPQQYNPSPSAGWDSGNQGQAPQVGDLRNNITPSYQSDPSQTQPQQQTAFNNPSGNSGPNNWSYPDD